MLNGIDVSKHQDVIDWNRDGVIYLCTRNTGNPVYNPLAELVRIYVEEV